jgi:hypothetical protein
MNEYYVVYFEGNALSAFGDWVGGRNTINKSQPFHNKIDAINATRKHRRACIVYHARNQICLHSQAGYVIQAIPDLMHWARSNITIPNEITMNDCMIEPVNEGQRWALSKIKHISHKVEFTEFRFALDNLSKLVKATVAGMIGNIPGILDVVSGLTIEICSGENVKKEDDAWIKDITDDKGNAGILVMKALSETSFKKKFWGKSEKNLYMTGLICILVPLTSEARLQCANIKNQHASTVITQIEKEFKFI